MENDFSTDEIERFIGNRLSLSLSTINLQHEPVVSYAPFVHSDDKTFYIFISELAEHTQNLNYAIKNGHKTSIMLIEDEKECQNIFARKRLNYLCNVELIERESEQWQQVLAIFREKFDQTIEVLMTLPDFKLFSLSARNGKFVSGFAKTYLYNGVGWSLYEHKKT